MREIGRETCADRHSKGGISDLITVLRGIGAQEEDRWSGGPQNDIWDFFRLWAGWPAAAASNHRNANLFEQRPP